MISAGINLASLSVQESEPVAAMPLLMGLFGGLALFLYGMDQMSGALKAVAGSRMKTVLATLTKNRFMGVLTGAFVTAVIQSSSVTTVLVVGFITAGIMSMAQSIGVIMGANIGTTITAQIVAFKVTKFSLLMIAIGFAMSFSSNRQRLRQQGTGVLGLGLVFLGMAIMGDAMAPLRSQQMFLDWMAHMESPSLGILAGALFTALVQSSSATTGVIIVLASQGLITLPAGIALSFGANIGTCVTALLAAIGKPREALRAAVVHVLFNVAGVLVWLGLIDHLAELVRTLSPSNGGVTPQDRLAAETPRQIANAHTIFNVSNTLIFIWFVPIFARIVQFLVPDRPLDEERLVRVKYLDSGLLDTPSLALDRARLELLHMGDRAGDMLKAALPALLTGEREDLKEVAAMDDAVDVLHGKVVTYLGQISQKRLTDEDTDELVKLLEAANDLESIGDVIETNLVAVGLRRVEENVVISDQTKQVITDFHTAVVRALEGALLAITQKNERAASAVISMKAEINKLANSAAMHEARRLVAEEPNRLEAYTIETDILENLKRVFYFCKRMARISVPAEVLVKEA